MVLETKYSLRFSINLLVLISVLLYCLWLVLILSIDYLSNILCFSLIYLYLEQILRNIFIALFWSCLWSGNFTSLQISVMSRQLFTSIETHSLFPGSPLSATCGHALGYKWSSTIFSTEVSFGRNSINFILRNNVFSLQSLEKNWSW